MRLRYSDRGQGKSAPGVCAPCECRRCRKEPALRCAVLRCSELQVHLLASINYRHFSIAHHSSTIARSMWYPLVLLLPLVWAGDDEVNDAMELILDNVRLNKESFSFIREMLDDLEGDLFDSDNGNGKDIGDDTIVDKWERDDRGEVILYNTMDNYMEAFDQNFKEWKESIQWSWTNVPLWYKNWRTINIAPFDKYSGPQYYLPDDHHRLDFFTDTVRGMMENLTNANLEPQGVYLYSGNVSYSNGTKRTSPPWEEVIKQNIHLVV